MIGEKIQPLHNQCLAWIWIIQNVTANKLFDIYFMKKFSRD